MNLLKLSTFVVLILAGLLAVTAFSAKHIAKEGSGFAVVELFTSEGCTSCPPADALVAKIQKETNGQPVYILAYHVDYWDHLGWRDPYSAAEYSQRQRKYSSWMNSSSVYTPQIVFNGSKEFIGSEEGTLRNAIRSAGQKSAVAELHLTDVKTSENHVTFRYQSTRVGRNESLVVALVQKAAKTYVKGGENGGRTLSHVQIVRQLQIIALNKTGNGTGEIETPKGPGHDLEIIAFLQNQSNGQITAAAKADLENATYN